MAANAGLVVIDMFNRYEHDDADRLMRSVRGTLPALRALILRAQSAGAPIVYVNDNYGDWSASAEKLYRQALTGRCPELVEPVVPPRGAAFVTKARHSIFYETSLDYLLRSQGIERLVLAGQVTEQCVLYSALDAYVRHYEVVVPRDAVAHIHADLADAALRMMERNMRAQVVEAEGLYADSELFSSPHAG